MSETVEAGTHLADEGGERNEWLELFFDLVVVAAVAVLTEGLREDASLLGLGLFALLYGGVWLCWVTEVLYANVAGAATNTRTVMVAMGLIAVMAATSPLHHDSRANAFAVGFLVLRGLITRASMSTGRLLTSWPLLQLGGASLPWVAAMWVDTPWKYLLWALGLLLDLGIVFFSRGRVDDRQVAHLSARFTEQREQALRRAERTAERIEKRAASVVAKHPEAAEEVEASRSEWAASTTVPGPESLEVVDIETQHLSERLGLFVIIVLGEVVSALVLTASTHEWTKAFVGVAIASFVLLLGLWWLTFSYGFVGAPHSRLAALPPRFGLPMHQLTSIGIVGIAAGIGEMALRPDEPVGGVLRWAMCAGLALHYLVMAVAGWVGGAPRLWALAWVLPCAALAVALGMFTGMTNEATTWVCVATTLWMGLYSRVSGNRPGRGRPGRGAGRKAPDETA
jgi:low temperature requirement protein LtrA